MKKVFDKRTKTRRENLATMGGIKSIMTADFQVLIFITSLYSSNSPLHLKIHNFLIENCLKMSNTLFRSTIFEVHGYSLKVVTDRIYIKI